MRGGSLFVVVSFAIEEKVAPFCTSLDHETSHCARLADRATPLKTSRSAVHEDGTLTLRHSCR